MTATYIRELKLSYTGKKRKLTDPLRTPDAVGKVIRNLLPDNRREHLLALYLNGSHEVIAYAVVSTGSANATQAHPREIFQPALVSGAVAIIVGHNHPSGQVLPSQEDKIMTKRVKDVGDLVGIKLLDHVIVSDHSYYSFNESGTL